MSTDYTSETEHFNELSWCPECQAPSNSDYAHVRYCDMHLPIQEGESDRLVEDSGAHIFNNEGGENGVVWCNWIHRQETTA